MKDQVRESMASFDSPTDQVEVVHLARTVENPIELEKSVLITTMLEYEKNKLILGLDEPGFLFIEKPKQFVSNTMQKHQFDIT